MSKRGAKNGGEPQVEFADTVIQQIRQHARSSMDAEICGVLIGAESGGVTRVEARIAGEQAAQGGAHVTFTQATWEHIYKVKDAQFPERSIVGWYHSHPGFGIFLSDYDLFIHENFFSALHQIAWVFDPHSDEEGCFGWVEKKVVPLRRVTVLREHRGPPVGAAEGAPPPKAEAASAGTGPAARGGRIVPLVVTIISAGLLLAVTFGAGFVVAVRLLPPPRDRLIRVPLPIHPNRPAGEPASSDPKQGAPKSAPPASASEPASPAGAAPTIPSLDRPAVESKPPTGVNDPGYNYNPASAAPAPANEAARPDRPAADETAKPPGQTPAGEPSKAAEPAPQPAAKPAEQTPPTADESPKPPPPARPEEPGETPPDAS